MHAKIILNVYKKGLFASWQGARRKSWEMHSFLAAIVSECVCFPKRAWAARAVRCVCWSLERKPPCTPFLAPVQESFKGHVWSPVIHFKFQQGNFKEKKNTNFRWKQLIFYIFLWVSGNFLTFSLFASIFGSCILY